MKDDDEIKDIQCIKFEYGTYFTCHIRFCYTSIQECEHSATLFTSLTCGDD